VPQEAIIVTIIVKRIADFIIEVLVFKYSFKI